MGARSKKIWLEIGGENTGRSFGGETANMGVCVDTSATHSNNICNIRVSSYEDSNKIFYRISIDGQTYKTTSFDRKTKEFAGVNGNVICGDPEYLEQKSENDSGSMLRSIGMVASMAEIFCDTKKSKNDWKKRMILAGVPEGSITFPDDWDSLSEEEKERRLNLSIEAISK
jgi:hypothetical protein